MYQKMACNMNGLPSKQTNEAKKQANKLASNPTNKQCDLINERRVSSEEAQNFASEHGLDNYVETSAVANLEVDALFAMAALKVLSRRFPLSPGTALASAVSRVCFSKLAKSATALPRHFHLGGHRYVQVYYTA